MNILFRLIRRSRFRKSLKANESRNVVEGMAKARTLYKTLSVRAHPDRNPDKRDVAEDITARLTQSKHNYAALLRLEKEIKERL